MKRIISIALFITIILSFNFSASAAIKSVTPNEQRDVIVEFDTTDYEKDKTQITLVVHPLDDPENFLYMTQFTYDGSNSVTINMEQDLITNVERGKYVIKLNDSLNNTQSTPDSEDLLEYVYGDVDYAAKDAKVDSSDLLKLAKYIVKFKAERELFEADPRYMAVSDVNHDGKVNSFDLLKIARFLVGWNNPNDGSRINLNRSGEY